MLIKTQIHKSAKGDITWITLTNQRGAEVVLSSLGAAIVSIKLPDADGKLTDVVIGYDEPEAYFADGPCAGKTPGRYANRMAKGHFTLGGKTYTLPINNGPNHLHGGPEGFQNKIWKVAVDPTGSVTFTLYSPNGDSGYPGALLANVKYTFDDNANSLNIDYSATTDAPTVVNLTNHSYFNLDGHDSGSVLDHTLQLNAPYWLPTDATQIPTGELAKVDGTPMDFCEPRSIGRDIKADFEALKIGKGYDHCWLIEGFNGKDMRLAATLKGPKSGRVLKVYTNQPAAQVYTGNWIGGTEGKGGYIYNDYDAVAIECQGAPDAPNHQNLPSQVLLPGDTYNRSIRFDFE